MKKSALFLSLVLSAPVALAQVTPEAKALIKAEMQQAPQVTPFELQKELESGKEVVLIDVRQKSERPIAGLITKNDVHIPRGYLEIQTYGKVADRNADIVVYCGKGIRSAFATNTLKEMGYQHVLNLKGGVMAWKKQGLPTISVQ